MTLSPKRDPKTVYRGNNLIAKARPVHWQGNAPEPAKHRPFLPVPAQVRCCGKCWGTSDGAGNAPGQEKSRACLHFVMCSPGGKW